MEAPCVRAVSPPHDDHHVYLLGQLSRALLAPHGGLADRVEHAQLSAPFGQGARDLAQSCRPLSRLHDQPIALAKGKSLHLVGRGDDLGLSAGPGGETLDLTMSSVPEDGDRISLLREASDAAVGALHEGTGCIYDREAARLRGVFDFGINAVGREHERSLPDLIERANLPYAARFEARHLLRVMDEGTERVDRTGVLVRRPCNQLKGALHSEAETGVFRNDYLHEIGRQPLTRLTKDAILDMASSMSGIEVA